MVTLCLIATTVSDIQPQALPFPVIILDFRHIADARFLNCVPLQAFKLQASGLLLKD